VHRCAGVLLTDVQLGNAAGVGPAAQLSFQNATLRGSSERGSSAVGLYLEHRAQAKVEGTTFEGIGDDLQLGKGTVVYTDEPKALTLQPQSVGRVLPLARPGPQFLTAEDASFSALQTVCAHTIDCLSCAHAFPQVSVVHPLAPLVVCCLPVCLACDSRWVV
jgi:hypothetical protein